MTLVVSDLHGYPLAKLLEKLAEIGFADEDKLYVLGDCIDRGKEGLKIIKWIMTKPNVTLIKGNHEAMLLKNRDILERDEIPAVLDLVGTERRNFSVWMANGGDTTVDSIGAYTKAQLRYLFDFIEEAPLYKEIEVGDKSYILCHSGLGDFKADKELSEYSEYDLLWTRISLDTRFFEDGRIVIFGHTPTDLYGSKYTNKPVFTDTWIDIDVGVARGYSPMLLRLDDMQEFYF